MISYIEDAPNIVAKELVQEHVEKYFDEVRQLLPELPDDIYIWLDNRHMIYEVGEGGFAYSPVTINLSFDVDFTDKAKQLKSFRGTIFHETFHMVQGFTFEEPRALMKTALDSAIYEGCATVFEREYADVLPLWGEYAQHDIATLKEWKNQLKSIPQSEYVDDAWETWAFYDAESGERWRVYKAGAWIVDEALKKSGLNILDLRLKSADDILKLAKS